MKKLAELCSPGMLFRHFHWYLQCTHFTHMTMDGAEDYTQGIIAPRRFISFIWTLSHHVSEHLLLRCLIFNQRNLWYDATCSVIWLFTTNTVYWKRVGGTCLVEIPSIFLKVKHTQLETNRCIFIKVTIFALTQLTYLS